MGVTRAGGGACSASYSLTFCLAVARVPAHRAVYPDRYDATAPTWQAWSMPAEQSQDRYTERIFPGPGAWLLAPSAGGALWLMFAAAGQIVALVIAVAGLVTVAVALWRGSPVLRVSDSGDGISWQVGSARIPVHLLSAPEPLDAEGMRAAMGPELNSTAFVCHRMWVRTGLRVSVADPADPTPFWLVSTRHPDRLAEVLVASGAQAAHSEHTG